MGEGSRGLLKLSQHGRSWDLVCAGSGAGGVWACGAGGCSFRRISAGQRWQHLTIHIENVIISVTTITKRLLVTRPSNLRCTAFFLFKV